jgi:hypothetical protein
MGCSPHIGLCRADNGIHEPAVFREFAINPVAIHLPLAGFRIVAAIQFR